MVKGCCWINFINSVVKIRNILKLYQNNFLRGSYVFEDG
jgi:hypothetical protein